MCKLLKVTQKRLYDLVARGQQGKPDGIPPHCVVRLGNQFRFRREAVVKWLSEGDKPEPSPAHLLASEPESRNASILKRRLKPKGQRRE